MKRSVTSGVNLLIIFARLFPLLAFTNALLPASWEPRGKRSARFGVVRGSAAQGAQGSRLAMNALWISWLKEWKSQKKDDHNRFGNAINSLRQHPEPIHNPNELAALKYFGPSTIKRIKQRCRDENIPIGLNQTPKVPVEPTTHAQLVELHFSYCG